MSLNPFNPPRFLSSLRWRLSLATSGLVLLCTAVCVAAAVVFLEQALTDRARVELRDTISGVSGYLEDQRTDLLGAAKIVADDPAVARSLQAGDRQTLIVRLTPYYADLNADVLDVITARGQVMVRMENTLAGGTNVGNLASVRQALAGNQVVAPWSDPAGGQAAGGYALRAAVPIRSGNRIVGVVVVGRQLGSIFAARIGRALDATVNLIAGNQRTGTTETDSHGLPDTGLPEPASVLARIGTGRQSIATAQEDGQPQLSGLVPLQGADGRWIGAVEVVRPLDPIYNVVKGLSILLLLLGTLVVALGTLLALTISRRLTSRLQVLEVTASRVAAMAGTDEPLGELPVGATVRGNDEVASLAQSFSAMMAALDERMAANASLYSAAQSRVRELSGLAEIARLLTVVPSVRETMDVLGEHVSRLVGSEAVAIWLPGEGSHPALNGGHGLPDEYEELSNRLISDLVDSGFETTAEEALRTGEIAHRRLIDEPPVTSSDSQQRLLSIMRSLGWSGATAVPLRIQGRVVGALTSYSRSADPPSASDLSLLTTIADQVAVAVENARLAFEAQEKAALEERRLGEEALRASEVRFRTLVEQSPFAIQIFAPNGDCLQVNQAHRNLWDFADDHLACFNALHDDILAALGLTPYFQRAFTGQAVTAPPVLHAPDNQATPGANHPHWIRTFIYPVKDDDGAIHEVIAVFEDITEQKEAEELLEQRVDERTRELSTLLDVTHNVTSTLELQPLLELILDQLKVVVDYNGSGVVVREDEELRVIGYRGPTSRGLAQPMRFSREGRRLWERPMRGESLIVDDVHGYDPYARAFRESVGDELESTYAHVRSFMIVPMTHRERMVGALTFEHSSARFYTPRHLALAMAIANQAAVAIENARLYEQAQEVAVLEERQRLARELHDSVSQALYGIALGARTARTLLDRDPAKAADPLDYVLSQAAAGLAEMRALIFELRPEALEREGLVAALDKHAESVRSRHGIAVHASLGSEPDVPFVVKEAIYRIAQEGLHNTVKHARARNVQVQLNSHDGNLVLEIKDDGLGFDPSGSFPGHLGLRTMRERATRLGGTMDVESSPGGGTRILACLPTKAALSRVG